MVAKPALTGGPACGRKPGFRPSKYLIWRGLATRDGFLRHPSPGGGQPCSLAGVGLEDRA